MQTKTQKENGTNKIDYLKNAELIFSIFII